jgi:hypothetical protein
VAAAPLDYLTYRGTAKALLLTRPRQPARELNIIRDVGVAGSNPVTPSIFKRRFGVSPSEIDCCYGRVRRLALVGVSTSRPVTNLCSTLEIRV